MLSARLRLAAMKSRANEASSSGVCSKREISTPPRRSPARSAIWQILLRRLKYAARMRAGNSAPTHAFHAGAAPRFTVQ